MLFSLILLIGILSVNGEFLDLKCENEKYVEWSHGPASQYPENSGAFLACGTEAFTLYVVSASNVKRVKIQAVNESGLPFDSSPSSQCSVISSYPLSLGPVGGVGSGPEVAIEAGFEIPEGLAIDTSFWDNLDYSDYLPESKTGKQPRETGGISFGFEECGVKALVDESGLRLGHQVLISIKENVDIGGGVQKITTTTIKVSCGVSVVQPENQPVTPTKGHGQVAACHESSYSLRTSVLNDELVSTITENYHPENDLLIGYSVDELRYGADTVVDEGEPTEIGREINADITRNAAVYSVHSDMVNIPGDHSLTVGATVNYCTTGGLNEGAHLCPGVTQCLDFGQKR